MSIWMPCVEYRPKCFLLKLSNLINNIPVLQIRKMRQRKVKKWTHFTQLLSSRAVRDKDISCSCISLFKICFSSNTFWYSFKCSNLHVILEQIPHLNKGYPSLLCTLWPVHSLTTSISVENGPTSDSSSDIRITGACFSPVLPFRCNFSLFQGNSNPAHFKTKKQGKHKWKNGSDFHLPPYLLSNFLFFLKLLTSICLQFSSFHCFTGLENCSNLAFTLT